MKFSKHKDGSWYCHENPFTFWIFENNENGYDVICHYGDSISRHISDTINNAERFCYDFALKITLAQLQAISPEGGRFAYVDNIPQFVCDGSISDMGYYCCLPIGHKGQCWTNIKKVNFDKE